MLFFPRLPFSLQRGCASGALWAICCLLVLTLGSASAWAQFAKPSDPSAPRAVVQTEQVRAELLVLAPDGVAAGKTVWLGLQLAHQPQWHTYWKNAGDSGLPTRLEWTLPAGVTAGDIAWPAPQKITIGTLANYGYEGTVLLPVRLLVDKTFAPVANTLDVQLFATWLVCKEVCVPQEGRFALQIPLSGSSALHEAAFAQAQAAQPLALQGKSAVQLNDFGLTLTVSGLPMAWRGQNINAFIESPEIIETARSPAATDSQPQRWQGDGSWTATLPYSSLRSTTPDSLAFVLSWGTHSLRTEATVSGAWPAATPGSVGAKPGELAEPSKRAEPSNPTLLAAHGSAARWGLALGAALLGGLLLNLMPCVFPVLAIKLLGLTRSSQSTASRRTQGLAYSAGVLLSFLALGGLMLALRAGGAQLGWGFQLQSPLVIALLALLFTLIGLNLLGLLDVGPVLPSGLASLQLRHPLGDAFLSGVLAVAIASPCTAPFMGASLGFAVALPAAPALGIFATLGLGLALPYLAVSWLPALAHALPRPGAWMETLRRFMAFPMWATVVWLLWVLGHLSGVDGAASLLALLLCLALLLWSLQQPGKSRWLLSGVALLLGLWLLWNLGPNVLREASAPAPGTAAGAAYSSADSGNSWQPWSAQRVEQALAAGQPVFVDFTAAWCITCQYNKQTTLSDARVLADFQRHKVRLLRADWTHRDPAITQALQSLGRSGVPVYVLYQSGKPPLLLSEVLGVGELRAALGRL